MKIAEMSTNNLIHLICTVKSWKARLSIQIRSPMFLEVIDGECLTESMVEEILPSTLNYEFITHNFKYSTFKIIKMSIYFFIVNHIFGITINHT